MAPPPSNNSDNIDPSIPTDIHGNPISDEGRLVYLAGALYEAGQFYTRTGMFETLLTLGASLVSNGDTAVESVQAIYFVSGLINDAHEYDFYKPCPPGDTRIKEFDDAAVLTSKPSFADSVKTITTTVPTNFKVNALKVRADDRDFANSLINIIGDSTLRASLMAECKGSGRKLVGLIQATADKLTNKEKQVARAEFETYSASPIFGTIDLTSFNLWYEQYERKLRRVPKLLRVAESVTVQTLIGQVFRDVSTADLFDVELRLEKPDPNDLLINLKVIRAFLQDRESTKQLRDAFAGGVDSPGALALASLGYTTDQIALLLAAAAADKPGSTKHLQLVAAQMPRDPIKDLRAAAPAGGWVKAPRNDDGSVSHFIEGMEPCSCGVGGGKHVRRDRAAGCTVPDFKPSTRGGRGRGRGAGGGRGQSSRLSLSESAEQAGVDDGNGELDPEVAKQLLSLYNSERASSVLIPAHTSLASAHTPLVDSGASAHVSRVATSSATSGPPVLLAESWTSRVSRSFSSLVASFVAYRFTILVLLIGIIAGAVGAYAIAAHVPVVQMAPLGGAINISNVSNTSGIRGALDAGAHDQVALASATLDDGHAVQAATIFGPITARHIEPVAPWVAITALLVWVQGIEKVLVWAATPIEATMQAPTAVMWLCSFVPTMLFSVFLPSVFHRFNAAFSVMSRVASSATRLKPVLPLTVACLIIASSYFCCASGPSNTSIDVGSLTTCKPGLDVANTSVITNVSLPAAKPVDFATTELSFPHASMISLEKASSAELSVRGSTGLPIICGTTDSGASASSTDDCRRLVNQRSCDEVFGGANGQLTRCTTIGDMPVIVKAGTEDGGLVRFAFTNVRCVPAFKYTLLSVTQLWREQQIDARFRDLNHLTLPVGDITVPFEKSMRLPTVVMISEAMLKPGNLSKSLVAADQTSLAVGFHAITSTAHIARMSAASAGELMHRRGHRGLTKTRALAHCTSDAPRVVGQASYCNCVFCVAAGMKKPKHSSSLRVPDPTPGTLHTDLKGPFPASIEGYKYAQFFVDEASRFIFVAFLKSKAEVLVATQLAIAEFNATVGTPVDDEGKIIGERPRVREIRRDHEGKYESHAFTSFRAAANPPIHSTASPPEDHDLNPIAERAIRTVDEVATAMFTQAAGKIGFWPQFIYHAVNWHNVTTSSVGTSTADSLISPYQRLTHRLPSCMDLATIGSRAVVLKPSTHMVRGALQPKGYIGVYLGRSKSSIGSHCVWANGTLMDSSSVLVDEEYLPWRGKDAHMPLAPSTRAPAPPAVKPLPRPAANNPNPGDLTCLNLFSGTYHRTNGLAERLRSFGWGEVLQIDNDAEVGGGWTHNLFNDELFTNLKQRCINGDFHAMVIAFPCSTYSISRFFNAPDANGNAGPPPVRNRNHPDGLPLDQIPPAHHKELREANALLDRTVELAVLARNSPSHTTLVFENPSDRSIKGSNQYSEELALHGSVFATSAFHRLQSAIPDSSTCTFAQCRFAGSFQKYTTLWYTNDAARVLDQLNGADFQCNHPPGTHEKIAGGRDDVGEWASKAAAAYPDGLNVRIAMALNAARTGSPNPSGQVKAPTAEPVPKAPSAPVHQPPVDPVTEVAPPAVPASAAAYRPTEPAGAIAASSPVRFPNLSASPASRAVNRRVSLDMDVDDFDDGAAAMGGDGTSRYDPIDPKLDPSSRQFVRPPLRAGAGKGVDRLDWKSSSQRTYTHPSIPESPSPSTPQHNVSLQRNISPAEDAPYTSFTGTPQFSSLSELMGSDLSAAEYAESFVASMMFDAHVGDELKHQPIGPEITLSTRCLADVAWRQLGDDTWVVEDDQRVREALLCLATESSMHVSLYTEIFESLRADSAGAPSTHKEAMSMGDPWPGAESTELGNHAHNKSWSYVRRELVPKGRRLHKLVWVYKLKRNGVAKARLCVQGCTMDKGIDFDQTFSQTLRYSSARGLFAAAARLGCGVRSVDWVAAYLQGMFVDGEVVYCTQAPGQNVLDENGVPLVLRIEKPVYGIPQSGRRLQRRIFPWMIGQGFRQLDDSDGSVFVRDCPNGETLMCGIYVDNCQIVHSAKCNEDGSPVDASSCYAQFMEALQRDWEVEDEGVMVDLLGMEVRYNDNGSITLHQTKFIDKLVERFFPTGVPSNVQSNSLPYSCNIQASVIAALSDHSPGQPMYPELVRPCQERIGSLMYLCNSSRPDVVYSTHLLCRCMCCPTPAIMAELDHTIAYLARNRSIGLTYSRDATKLRGYSDASWETKHSTSGWVTFWQSAALTWGSRKQNCIALSSCEAEIIALSEGTKDMVYVRRLVSGLLPSSIDGPSELATDNMGARDVAYNPCAHDRMKHVDRRHFFVRDMVEKFEIVVPFVRTADNWADFFTKPFFKENKKFFAMRKIIMNLPDAAEQVAGRTSHRWLRA